VVALHNPVPVWRARLLLAKGEVAEAARWADAPGTGVADQPDYPREIEYLVLARVLPAQQKPDQALALLERLHGEAEA
jgi:LuxR family transcriptional regulator, maltose regulon positive regulatory protein